LQREQAHAVVIDPLYYAAAIAAHRIGLPWASVSNSLNPVLPDAIDSALLRTMRRIDPRRSALFAQHGLSACFRSADVLSPFLTIAFTTPALVGDVEGVEQVGPSWPLRLRGDEVPLQPLPAGVPVIYASFGSQIYHWPHIFDKLIAAAARLSSHIVLSMGDLARRDPPPHCHMYSYAPQLQVLRHASVFITHGGANSVMEAITASVPMLISPMCNDQFHQAWFVERAEIGLSMDLNTAGIADIAECLARLCDPSSRQRAAIRRVSASYQVNGSHRAAALIAGMVR
jgi:UDP:flavonoid glycosyltransferase YjiC (YdhE family)